ncbi:MAG: DUF2490 domain-containing protein [Bacteroidetes bacterium]|nr:DUF2490 domain-containing protein [Bacteroidota bacterium]MDA0938631.1 DUF2490 domain-containing protein [Bacteroidota bacterium]MDA1345125.1 DUF2490 domain-containing protein [Bacteroidota bacterium]
MKNFFFLLLTGFSALNLQAQENEFKAWNTIEYGMDISKKWSIDLSQHFRLKEGLKTVDSYITQTELYYKPAKEWKISTQFRYYYRNDTKGGIQGFENMLRYRVGIEKKFKTKPGNFEFRTMYQNRFSIDRTNRSKKAVRYRSLFEWKIKNWSYDPKFYFEYIDEIKGDDQKSYRYGVGTKIKFTDTRALSVRYFFERKVEPFHLDRSAHVLSLNYAFSKKEKEQAKEKK